jgi:hypothetical protein
VIAKQAVALADFYSLYALLAALSRFVSFGLMTLAIIPLT